MVDAEAVVRTAYRAFNARDLDAALAQMHPDVDWPNAWEGGRVHGREAVREYWRRQFATVSPEAKPERFTVEPDGAVTVHVQQVVHDAASGVLLTDARVRHRYELEDGLVTRMDVLPAEPRAEPLDLPAEYGTPATLLAWDTVRRRLEAAQRYWLATVRPDGRPHAVPLDGLWLDEAWYFGGSSAAVWHRNLEADPRAALHLEDAMQAVMVEGACERHATDAHLAGRLAGASRSKYGYGPDPKPAEVWRLRPERALAWTAFPRDATRFVFDPAG
jgi:hypothetical protein